MPGFAPRQIFIVHESLWNALERWADDHNFRLDRIPDGADENGVPFFRENKPETECPQCGHTPTYSFMPSQQGAAQSQTRKSGAVLWQVVLETAPNHENHLGGNDDCSNSGGR